MPFFSSNLYDWKMRRAMAGLWEDIKQGDLNQVIRKVTRNRQLLTATDKENDTLLLLSLHVDAKKENIARWLIQQEPDIDIDHRGQDGFTPLISACRNGMPAIARILIERNANLNLADDQGWTPLMYACHYAQTTVALELIQRGASVNEAESQGFTALMLACRYSVRGMSEVVRSLIANGAELDRVNQGGFSALMLGCLQSKPDDVAGNEDQYMLECVQECYASGATTDLRCYGQVELDALGLARRFQREDAVNFLEFAVESSLAETVLEELKLPRRLIVELHRLHVSTAEDCRELEEDDLQAMSFLKPMQRRKFLYRFKRRAVSPAAPIAHRRRRSTIKRYDAFLSHSWDEDRMGRNNHERVQALSSRLADNGLLPWLDSKEMLSGDQLPRKIAKGIEGADFFVVCLTESYMHKVNGSATNYCKLEFGMASNRFKHDRLIPVVMEPYMKDQKNWYGTMQLFLGTHMYIDFSTDELVEKNLEALVSRINQLASS